MTKITRRMPLREEYFKYLYNLIRPLPRAYYVLCAELHNTKFRWNVLNDDNRCEDGLRLRESFIDSQGLDESHLEVGGFKEGDCTVLEMMIGLANRMDYELSDLIAPGNHTNKYFFEMLVNLKLDIYTDRMAISRRFNRIVEAEINSILEVFLSRTYGYNGDGGLFPLRRRPPKDMSKVELWYQMMSYIRENYG